MAALSYRQVSDVYKTLADAGVQVGDLPEFSAGLNQSSGTQDYSAGLNDNFVKRTSVGIDRLLEATGLPNLTGAIGRGAGSLVGAPDIGESIGRGLPRSAVNFLPAIAGPWGLPAVAALSGAEGYTNTGSAGAGVVSGAINALMPGVANFGENAVLKGLGTKLLSGPIADAEGNIIGQASKYFPTAGQKVASFLGGQATAGAFGEVGSMAQSAIDPNSEYHFSPTQALLQMTLGQIPFAAMHVAGKAFGRESAPIGYDDLQKQLASSQTAIAEKTKRDASDNTPPISKLPDVTQPAEISPVTQADINARLAKIRGEKAAVLANEEPDIRQYDDLGRVELEAMTASDKTGVLGEKVAPESERFDVTGTTHFENSKTGYRIVRLDDSETNKAQGFTPGQLVGYSTKFEPAIRLVDSESGTNTYSIPKRFHDPTIVDNKPAIATVKAAQNPELPLQSESGLDRVREQAHDFDRVMTGLNNVQEGDTEGFRKAIESVNGMRQKWGYEPLTDKDIAARQEKFAAKTPLDAVKGQTTDLMDRIAKKEALMQQREAKLTELRNEFVKDPDMLKMYQATEGGRAGSFEKALLQWDADGRPGGIEGLRSRALKAKQQGGTGAPKVVEDPTAKPAKDNSPETEHVRALRRTVAEQVTESVNPDLEGDAQEFREAFTDGSLLSDPALKEFAQQEHVQEWLADATGEMKGVMNHPAQPKGSTVDFTSPRPWTPQTDYEKAAYAALSPDEGGPGLLRAISRSENPLTTAIAFDIAKNFSESLKRVKVRIMEQSHEGTARTIGNREAEIVLSHATVTSADAARRETVMLHELLHALTMNELDNPTKRPLVKELEQMRQRVLDQLPDNVRKRVEFLQNTDWMSTFSTGINAYDTISGFDSALKSWQPVMYGLLNNHEFVTQGFTSPQMKQLLQKLGTSSGGPKTNGFIGWVKRLLNIGQNVSDNEFAKFIDITSRILDQGNWVSDVSNFTDRWFGDKGYAPPLVRNLSRRALELIQSSAMPLNKDLVTDFLTGDEPVSKSFADAKQGITDLFAGDSDEKWSAQSVLGELDMDQNRLDNLLVEHLGGRMPDMDTAMDMLPAPVTKYLFERASDMKEILSAVKAATDSKNKGLLNLADPERLQGPVNATLDSVNKFLAKQERENHDRLLLARMAAVAPDAFFDGVLSEPRFAPPAPEERNSLLDWVGNAIGASGGRAFQKFLEQPAQIARSNPIFGEWYSKTLMMNGAIRKMSQAAMDIFGRAIRADGSLGPETAKGELDKTYKALQSGKLRTALDKLIYLKQQRGGNEVKPIDYNDIQVQALMSDLNPQERQDLMTLDNKLRLSKIAMDQQTLQSMRNVFSSLGARVVMRDSGLKLDNATQLASTVFDAVNADYTNPQQAQQANAQLNIAQSKMTPDGFLNLLKFTQDSVQQHQIYRKYLSENTDWVSAQRNGSYLFEFKKNGKTVLASAENMKEALQRSGGKPVENWRRNERDDDSQVFLGNNATDIVQQLRQLESNQFDMLKGQMSPEDLAALQRTSPVAQFERQLNATQRGIPLELEGRTLSKGASELPWFENHIDWIQKNASYWQRRLLRTQGQSMLTEPGTEGTPTADLIKQHMDELFQKDPEIGRKIQQVTSTWALGFNAASQIANLSQTWMRGVTELIRQGVGPIKAMNLMKDTWGDYIGHKVTDKPYKTGEEQKFLKDALHDGQIDQTLFDDDAAAQANSATNFKRVLNGDKPKSVGQYLTSALGAYQTAGMWMFKHGERANHEVMLLSAFRALKELQPELSYDEAKRQSYLLNASVNDAGGRANRSLGLYSGKGDFARTAAMTMSSLQSYMLGSTFQLIRNLKAGLFRPSGLTPSEVYAARKAATYQLGVQLFAAGALGMPFVSGTLALINQMFPELEVNRRLREGVADLVGSDSENGKVMTDMALSGVPSMMGWDWSSRLNAGNVLPGVSEYDGFQPESLLGVPFSTVSNFVKGTKQLAAGDPAGGYSFLPPGIKKIVQLASNGGQLNDYKNRPLLTPTPGEALGIALGFNPKRLTDLNAASRMASQQQEQDTRRQGQVNQQLAQEAMRGNFGTVRQSLLSQTQQNPQYNQVSAVRAIAQAAEDMTFPKDLRQSGSIQGSAARSRLLSTFNLDPSTSSEVARLQFRQGIEQRLGLVENDKGSFVMAQLMDQLRGQRPEATRAELRLAASSLLRQRHPELLAPQ